MLVGVEAEAQLEAPEVRGVEVMEQQEERRLLEPQILVEVAVVVVKMVPQQQVAPVPSLLDI